VMSVHLLASADVKGFAGDVGGQVGGQVGAGVADVLGGLRAAQRNAGQQRLPAVLAVELAQDAGVGAVAASRAGTRPSRFASELLRVGP
jgi:hypothetical protein